MANRRAAYRSKYLTREPKRLCGKFTVVNAANATLTRSGAPYNEGIYSITHEGTGVYQISLGRTASDIDKYTNFAGIRCTFSEADRYAYISNDSSSSDSDPYVNVTVTYGTTNNDAVNIANDQSVWFELLFLDSTD